MSGAILHFSSGFEAGTVLDPYCTSCWQEFSGTDESTGFTWPNILGGILTMHDINAYGTAEIITGTGHRGTSTRMLHSKLDGASVSGFCCSQTVLELSRFPGDAGPTSYYQRFWMRFPDDPGSYGGSDWTTVAEYKAARDSRIQKIALDVYGLRGTPFWNLTGYDRLSPQTVDWVESNRTVPVPLGSWFLVEVHMLRSSGSDGRFAMAIDGTILFDRTGPNSSGAPVDRIFFPSSYGSRTPKWIDDIELWDRPPCEVFPCR